MKIFRFILDQTPTRTVIDPFCGWGTVLAVANALGLAAIGIDLSARMCRRARTLTVDLSTDRAPRPNAAPAATNDSPPPHGEASRSPVPERA